MTYATEMREVEQNVQSNLTDRPKLSTGFSENYVASVGQVLDENLSISEQLVRGEGLWGQFSDSQFNYGDRNKEIMRLRKEGTVTDDEILAFTRTQGRNKHRITNYGMLAEYLQNERGLEIETNEDIDANMRQALKDRKEYAADVVARQNGFGAVGEVAGGFVGYGMEPITIAGVGFESVLLARSAYAMSQATTRIGRALQTAKAGVVAGAVSEAMIQPELFNWKEEIGVDMTWGDALMNIAAVAVTSGVIGSAAGFLSKGKGMTARDLTEVLSGLQREAKALNLDDEAVQALSQMQKEVETLPKGADVQEHMEGVDAAAERINNAKVERDIDENFDEGFSDADLEVEIQRMVDEGREGYAQFTGASGDMDFGKLTDYEMRMNERKEILSSCIGGG